VGYTIAKGTLRMSQAFQYDVFLSHSAKDKAVVRPLAERLRADGLKVWPVPPKRLRAGGFDEWVLKPGDSIEGSQSKTAKIEEGLEHSRVLACPAVVPARRRMLCMSAQAFGSDWAQLACPAVASGRRRKAGTFRFRDPLNQERRFIPLRLDDALIKGSLTQFPYIIGLKEVSISDSVLAKHICTPQHEVGMPPLFQDRGAVVQQNH